MTRRRTDNRHRGDARGLARRRSNPDAARPQAENRTGTPSGSAPSSPRTATSLWFRITSEAVRRMREQTPAGPAATAWSTSSSLGCRRTTRWYEDRTLRVTDSLASLGPDDRLRLKQRTR